MSIGERIRKLRRERNWTQEELGKRVGIPATNIARYENDKNLPRKAMMQRLAEAFNLAVEDLEADRVLPDFCQADPELTVLFRDIASMPEPDRAALKRILTMIVRQSRIQQMIAS